MTNEIMYPALAVLLLVGLVLLLRWVEKPPASVDVNQESAQGLWDPAGLALAARIFDSADYYWLRDQIGFPHLADSLYEDRRRLALGWLRAARSSFEDLLRIPEPPQSFEGRPAKHSGWQLLGQVVRFQLVLFYASFVVRYFGPYHSLVPGFRWISPVPNVRLSEDVIAASHSGHPR
jgi:hypothetical protein